MLTRKNLSLLGVWLLLVVAAYFAGKLFWGWSGPVNPQEKAQRVYQPVVAANQSHQTARKTLRKQRSDIETILAANLFGDDQSTAKVTQKKQKLDAPETRLKFELQGIFVSSNVDQTRALIAEKGKPARSYKKEDPLPGNVVLDDILEDRVLLRRAGRLESLSFPKQRDSKNTAKSQDMLTYHPKNSTTDIVKENKQAYYDDPVKSFRNFGLEIDDDADGLRFEGGANSNMLERAGLKKGDLIRSVNGNALSDFRADKQLADSVVASGELTVEIERDGQPIVLSLPVP